MTDKKTTDESAATALDGTELIRGVQSGANVKITANQLKTFTNVPGTPVNAVQFNNPLGTFDGDADFTWVTGFGLAIGGATESGGIVTPGSGGEVFAVGNYAVPKFSVAYPGDPVNGVVYTATYDLILNNYLSGDLTSVFPGGLVVYDGLKHTGVGSAYYFGLDFEPSINSDSTGPWQEINGAFFGPINYGSGDVDTLNGMNFSVAHEGAGTIANLRTNIQIGYIGGTVTDFFGLYNTGVIEAAGVLGTYYGIYQPSPSVAGSVTDVHGIWIGDHSALGSGINNNITSKGSGSLNIFEGNAQFGAATESAGVVTPGGSGRVAIGNYAVADWITYAPGDPVNGSTYTLNTVCNVNNYIAGDASVYANGIVGLTDYIGLKHTGTDPLIVYLGGDITSTINSDSTGPVTYYYGLSFFAVNYGSGDIGEMNGISGEADHLGSGNINGNGLRALRANVYVDSAGDIAYLAGIHSEILIPNAGTVSLLKGINLYISVGTATVTDAYGLYVPDYSGIGTNDSINIISKGTNSLNVFEGKVSVGAQFTEGVVALVDGATPALDASKGNIFTLSAAGDRTIAVPTNPISGQKIIIEHTASGGARTLALNTGAGGFRFGTDITGLTATGSGLTDYIGCIYNAAANFWDVVAYVKGY